MSSIGQKYLLNDPVSTVLPFSFECVLLSLKVQYELLYLRGRPWSPWWAAWPIRPSPPAAAGPETWAEGPQAFVSLPPNSMDYNKQKTTVIPDVCGTFLLFCAGTLENRIVSYISKQKPQFLQQDGPLCCFCSGLLLKCIAFVLMWTRLHPGRLLGFSPPTCSPSLWAAWQRETASPSASSGTAARPCGCAAPCGGRRRIRPEPPAEGPPSPSLQTHTGPPTGEDIYYVSSSTRVWIKPHSDGSNTRRPSDVNAEQGTDDITSLKPIDCFDELLLLKWASMNERIFNI